MNGKKLIFAVSALVIAVLILVIGEQLGKKKPSDKALQFFPNLTQKDISAFEISDATNKIKIQRKGDIWVIGSDNSSSLTFNPMKSDSGTAQTPSMSQEFRADSASVVSVLEKIVSIKKDQLISENPAKQSLFEVDSAKGILVEIFDNAGKSKGSFRIGKSGPDYNSNYVRMTRSNSVYSVGGSIEYSFFTDHKRWIDKSVLKFDRSTAQGISILKKDGSKVVMAKDSGAAWSLKEPLQAPVKSDEIETILSTLSQFIATEIDTEILNDSAAGLSSPELVVAITFSNGTTKNVVFGTKNADGLYRLKADGKKHIYLVGEYEFDKFNKKPDEYKDDTPKDTTAVSTAK